MFGRHKWEVPQIRFKFKNELTHTSYFRMDLFNTSATE